MSYLNIFKDEIEERSSSIFACSLVKNECFVFISQYFTISANFEMQLVTNSSL